MTKEEQKRFVLELLTSIGTDISVSIELGQVPESWTGVELRYLLADKFIDARTVKMSAKQLGEYNRVCYENDL